jgi:hypothetical protein
MSLRTGAVTLLVSGSHTIDSAHWVYTRLDAALGEWGLTHRDVGLVLTGRASGVDQAAREWAEHYGMRLEFHQPKDHTRQAIVDANMLMLAKATHVVCLWDGTSPGTGHVVKEVAGRPVIQSKVYKK